MELKMMDEPARPKNRLTSLLCVQYMANGDSGEFLTMHVRLMVEPVFMNISGPPIIDVNGSVNVIFDMSLTLGWKLERLTDDRKVDRIASRRCGRNLALVDARVSNLWIAKLLRERIDVTIENSITFAVNSPLVSIPRLLCRECTETDCPRCTKIFRR
jgi:hypothetical protein